MNLPTENALTVEPGAVAASMKLAILGATGGVGHELVAQALAAGHEVTALVRAQPQPGEIDGRVVLVIGDAAGHAEPASGLAIVDDRGASAPTTSPGRVSGAMRHRAVWDCRWITENA